MENIVLEKINFVNGSAGKTPLNSNNMNAIQQNIENAINEVVPIITGIEENTENNINDLLATKQFIENSMKTLQTEGTSIHVNDSADYPCKLEIEGKSEQVQTKQGKNLLPFKDINFTLKGVNFYTENGNLYLNGSSTGEILTNDNAYITYLNFKLPAGTYKFKHFSSLNVNMAIQLKNVSDKSELASINLNSNTVKTFTLNEETEVYLGIYIYNQNFNNENLKLMLSIEDATEYEPFIPDSPSPNYRSDIENVSGDLEIKVVGKNLARVANGKEKTEVGIPIIKVEDDTIKINGTCEIRTAGQSAIKFSGNNIKLANYIPNISLDEDDIILKPGEYKLKIFDVTGEISNQNQVRFGVKYQKKGESQVKSFDFSVGLASNNEYSFTLQEESQIGIVLNCIVESSPITFTNVSFKCGLYRAAETMSKFEPYKEQIVTFPLGEQKLMKDGYLSEDGIHNKRKQIKLRDLTWVKYTVTDNLGDTYGFSSNLIEEPKQDNINTNFALCNILKQKRRQIVGTTAEEGFYIGAGKAIYIKINKTFLPNGTVEKLQTLLENTNAILEYELAEEEITPYTEQQQTAYNALQALKTYRTVTNISNNQDTNMKLTYKKDLQTQFQEIEALVLESGV